MTPAEYACLQSFRDYVRASYRDKFATGNEPLFELVAEDWFHCDERHEHRFEELRKRLPGAQKILDLASGMGTALLYGISQGFDGFGIEPDAQKLAFTAQRIAAGEMPAEWNARFQRAVGEALPFPDDSFDAILSYQTLEHVQNLEAVLREMLRTVRGGGALHLRCPDYRGTFEGHYLLPWLPLMPRALAKAYLRLLGRPLEELNALNYTTQPGILRILRRVEKETSGLHLEIIDLERERFLTRLREKRLPVWSGLYPLWKIVKQLRNLFRQEMQLNLWVRVWKTSSAN